MLYKIPTLRKRGTGYKETMPFLPFFLSLKLVKIRSSHQRIALPHINIFTLFKKYIHSCIGTVHFKKLLQLLSVGKIMEVLQIVTKKLIFAIISYINVIQSPNMESICKFSQLINLR